MIYPNGKFDVAVDFGFGPVAMAKDEIDHKVKSETYRECPDCGQIAFWDGVCNSSDCITNWKGPQVGRGEKVVGWDGDKVNSPSHYNQGSIECIDYIREVLTPEGFISYCQGNVQKYLHRWRDKDEPLQDLEKAHVYLGWMVETYKEMSDEKV